MTPERGRSEKTKFELVTTESGRIVRKKVVLIKVAVGYYGNTSYTEPRVAPRDFITWSTDISQNSPSNGMSGSSAKIFSVTRPIDLSFRETLVFLGNESINHSSSETLRLAISNVALDDNRKSALGSRMIEIPGDLRFF